MWSKETTHLKWTKGQEQTVEWHYFVGKGLSFRTKNKKINLKNVELPTCSFRSSHVHRKVRFLLL